MNRCVTLSVGLAAVVAAALAGCGGEGSVARDEDRPQAPSAEQSPNARAGIPEATPKSALRALETATGHIDDGTAFSLDWKTADGGAWQIEVAGEGSTAHKVTVAEDGGEKLDTGSGDAADHGDMANAVDAQVDAAKVVRTATGDHSGGVDGLQIGELGDGTPVWRITLDDSGERTRYVFSTDTGDEISSQRDAG